MKNDKLLKSINGVLQVQLIVNNLWKSDWIKIDQENDDGIDGIIQVRKKGEWTGEAIYVQVKSGNGYKVETRNRPNKIGLQLGEKYIKDHRPRWDKLRGAVILIFVDDNNKAYWTDLKNEGSYTNENRSIILISKKNRFGLHSKGHFKKIGSFFPEDRSLQTINLSIDELSYIRINEPIKYFAREFYKNWSRSSPEERYNKILGEVIVNRVGWRHISRKKRGYDKIYQSWLLLGVAKKIIQDCNSFYEFRRAGKVNKGKGSRLNCSYALRAKVIFPNRHESVVQVIIRGFKRFSTETNLIEQKYWFYSVYEPRSGINIQ